MIKILRLHFKKRFPKIEYLFLDLVSTGYHTPNLGTECNFFLTNLKCCIGYGVIGTTKQKIAVAFGNVYLNLC